jgi:hypothetical protein
VQHVARRFHLVVAFYEQDVAIPCVPRRACGQPSKHVDSVYLKDVSLMADIARLKHDERGFARINAWAIEREIF